MSSIWKCENEYRWRRSWKRCWSISTRRIWKYWRDLPI